jgi:hypothetical protein
MKQRNKERLQNAKGLKNKYSKIVGNYIQGGLIQLTRPYLSPVVESSRGIEIVLTSSNKKLLLLKWLLTALKFKKQYFTQRIFCEDMTEYFHLVSKQVFPEEFTKLFFILWSINYTHQYFYCFVLLSSTTLTYE